VGAYLTGSGNCSFNFALHHVRFESQSNLSNRQRSIAFLPSDAQLNGTLEQNTSMPRKPPGKWLTDEVADFLASHPSRDEILAYHPSQRVVERHRYLVEQAKCGTLNADEQIELDQFEHVEILMQSIKARLHTSRPVGA
jgi:hypothetical protein